MTKRSFLCKNFFINQRKQKKLKQKGQALTEYVLVIAFAIVIFAMIFAGKFETGMFHGDFKTTLQNGQENFKQKHKNNIIVIDVTPHP